MANHDPVTFEDAVRDDLTKSRTIKGSRTAGIVTISAAWVEMMRQAESDTQSAILPMVEYDTALQARAAEEVLVLLKGLM